MTTFCTALSKGINLKLNHCFVTAFSLLLLLSTNLYAQQTKPGYALLWKITGKGVTKPSYIFGTMHVKDKRVFGFSDSVMLAIKSCPAFALEIHPDTLIKQMFDTMGNRDSTNSLRTLLGKEEFEKFARKFEAKNGYPPGDIDAIQAESMMQAVKAKPDDRQAFVDAYLYGVARGMGKNIYGLEHTRDQLKELRESTRLKVRLEDIVNGDEQEEFEQTEEMIRLYSAGNLSSIAEYLGDEHLDDSVLITRNHVMVNSIRPHLINDPIFAAVGVAHLLGDNGLITLLKNEGYSVEPVSATFTGVANSFNTNYTGLDWIKYTEPEKGYSISFPFQPMKTNISLGINAVLFPDLGNEMFLGMYAVLDGSGGENAIEKIIKRFIDKGERIISRKSMLVDGLKTTEVIVKSESNTLRYRFIRNNNFLYCIYAGNDLNSVNSAYANKFFNSFKSFKPNIAKGEKWMSYKNDTAAFSINLPYKPLEIKQRIPNPQNPNSIFDINIYLATDSLNLINYLVRYNDYPKGSYLSDKKKAFESLSSELTSKGATITKTRIIFLQGVEGREIEFVLKGYNCKGQFFVRGNRIYFVLKQNLNGDAISIGNDFFNTLKFLPYSMPTLNAYESDNANYQIKVFENVYEPADSSRHFNSFLRPGETLYSTNLKTGGLFGMEHATFSNYYRVANTDSIYNLLIKTYIGYSDSLIKKNQVTVNGITGWELLSYNKYKQQKYRTRLLIDNNDIFTFSSHTGEEDLYSDAANEFYNSLKIVKKSVKPSFTNSKAKLILNDLTNPDSTTRRYASGALNYYTFDKTELNDLLAAAGKKYSDDNSDNGTRVQLIEAIAKLKEPKSLTTLVNIFDSTKSDYIRASILQALVKIDTVKGYDEYLGLLMRDPINNPDVTYYVFRPLSDSIQYAAANYDQILQLLKYPVYRRSLLSLSQSMVSKSQRDKYLPLVKGHFAELTKYADEDLALYLADTSGKNWLHGVYNYLQLMTAIKGQTITDRFTNTIISKDNYKGMVSDAVTTRLDNKLPVNAIVINRLLDSASLKYTILESLSKNGKLAMALPRHRTVAGFAKASLYEFIQSEDEGSATNVRLAGTLQENGSQYFIFKFDSEYNEDAHYIAICGPYKIGSKKLDFSTYRAYTDWKDEKTDWRIHAKKMLPELKKANRDALANLSKQN